MGLRSRQRRWACALQDRSSMSYGVTPQLRAPLQKRGRDAYSALGGDPYSFGSKARRLGATSANNLNCGRGFGRLARMIESTVVADKGKRVEVVGYMRPSSATNVGDGKDSEARQRKAIEGYPAEMGATHEESRRLAAGSLSA